MHSSLLMNRMRRFCLTNKSVVTFTWKTAQDVNREMQWCLTRLPATVLDSLTYGGLGYCGEILGAFITQEIQRKAARQGHSSQLFFSKKKVHVLSHLVVATQTRNWVPDVLFVTRTRRQRRLCRGACRSGCHAWNGPGNRIVCRRNNALRAQPV